MKELDYKEMYELSNSLRRNQSMELDKQRKINENYNRLTNQDKEEEKAHRTYLKKTGFLLSFMSGAALGLAFLIGELVGRGGF